MLLYIISNRESLNNQHLLYCIERDYFGHDKSKFASSTEQDTHIISILY